MPPKKKARSGEGASPAKSPRTPSANGTSSKARSKPIVPKAKVKSTKKEAPPQANTLFDFYPNLSKNAPLFRPTLAGDEPAIQDAREPRVSVSKDDLPIVENCPPPGAEAVCDPPDVDAKDDEKSSAFGPFSLDDDLDNQDETRGGEPPKYSTNGTHESPTRPMTSGAGTPTKVARPVDENGEEEEAEEDGDASTSAGIEIDLQEERDRFENADDEENEDEQWSWQEYNSENFGMHVSRDEAVLCPVCGESIIALPEHDRSAHVNRCLDLPPPPEDENQVDGAPLVDSTVKREMSDPQILSREESASAGKVKREEIVPELPFVKAERLDDEIEDWSSPEVKREMSHVKEEVKEEFGVKKEITDKKPSLVTSTSNAFDKIMVNHTEEKQWADAAKTENAQRGTKYKTRVCPFYKILSPFPIAVDAFKYGIVPGVEGYYLTHFHSDHYGGLSSTWDAGPIYCSSITGSLVIQQLKVRPEYVVKLPMNETVDINGTLITLIDANHCPGSTLFLFEGHARGRQLRYLHCGDFRATPTQLLHPAIRGKKIDSLYLDTTYLSPKYAFPSQEDVIEACAHVCCDLAGLLPDGSNPVADARNASAISKFLNQKSSEAIASTSENSSEVVKKKPRGRLLVVVGTYSIGKERIVLGIAKALGSKIFAAQRKRDILSCLEDPDLLSRLTTDPLEAQVHMTYLQEIRAETLADYLTGFHPHFGRIVGFRGTGWTYSPPKTRFLDNPSVEQIMSWNPRYTFGHMSPGRGSNSVAACYGVPYSEHSSFRELMCFCLSSDLGRVIPTVNVGSERSRKLMKSWIDKWAQEVRKHGLRPLVDGQVEWR